MTIWKPLCFISGIIILGFGVYDESLVRIVAGFGLMFFGGLIE